MEFFGSLLMHCFNDIIEDKVNAAKVYPSGS
jgi:hypothetical protein